MYEIQKYFNAMTGGYLLYDIIFCTFVFKKDALMMQTYMHHVAGIIGALCSIYLDGYYGSIAHLTMFTEISTLNVNIRVLLTLIGLGDGILYAINGLMMTVIFFVTRIIGYSYVVIFKFMIQPKSKFWSTEFRENDPEYKDKYGMLIFCIVTYALMGVLQMFWFNKMFRGCMKALRKASGPPKVESKKD
jgi:hypothetical protein